jgi:hypothetical protein
MYQALSSVPKGRDKERVLVLLLMDASTSMGSYGNTPLRAVKQYIRSLIKADDGKEYYVGVLGFNRTAFKILAMNEVHEIDLANLEYGLKGGTHLYDTVDATLREMLVFWKELDPDFTKVVIGVFSDGWDRWSNAQTQPASCQFMSCSTTLIGWKLLAFGIGIDGRLLAKNLGFPEANGHTVSASREGIMEASRGFSECTLGFGHRPDPQEFILENSQPSG